jgi:hypothetical protein
VAALEYGSTAEAVLKRIYNVTSGIELIAEGISTDYGLRLFETGWSGQDVFAAWKVYAFHCAASGQRAGRSLHPGTRTR